MLTTGNDLFVIDKKYITEKPTTLYYGRYDKFSTKFAIFDEQEVPLFKCKYAMGCPHRITDLQKNEIATITIEKDDSGLRKKKTDTKFINHPVHIVVVGDADKSNLYKFYFKIYTYYMGKSQLFSAVFEKNIYYLYMGADDDDKQLILQYKHNIFKLSNLEKCKIEIFIGDVDILYMVSILMSVVALYHTIRHKNV